MTIRENTSKVFLFFGFINFILKPFFSNDRGSSCPYFQIVTQNLTQLIAHCNRSRTKKLREYIVDNNLGVDIQV